MDARPRQVTTRPVPNEREVGDALLRHRQIRELSQRQVASAVGRTQGTISNYEHGVRGMTLRDAQTLAAYYGLTVEQLTTIPEVTR